MRVPLDRILASAGLGAQSAGEWRGRCPACHYKDAFAVRVPPGRAPLLHCFNGCDRKALYAAFNRATGAGLRTPNYSQCGARAEADIQAAKKARAMHLWAEAVPLVGTVGDNYLVLRKVQHLANSEALRFHGAAPHPGGGTGPAMLALVVDVTGSPMAVHRTFLASDGRGKAPTSVPRASIGAIAGNAIRLAELGPGQPLIVGEGIETAASAGVLIGVPAWAAISAGNLERNLALPPEVRDVMIAVDPDTPGMRAARAACRRWRLEGRKVRYVLPEGNGDFNDILCAKRKEADHV